MEYSRPSRDCGRESREATHVIHDRNHRAGGSEIQRRAAAAERRRVRRPPAGPQRVDRQTAGCHCVVSWCRRRGRCAPIGAHAGSRGGGPRRWAQCRRPRGDRWRPDDRPVAHERHTRRRGGADGARSGRSRVAGIQSRDAVARTRDDRRRRRQHRNRRVDAGWRYRLAYAEGRPRAR